MELELKAMDSGTILHDHKNLVYHLIQRLVYNKNAHDELFQEVFVNVLQGWPSFKGKSKLSTWISSITIHTCYNHIKKMKKTDHTYSLNQWLDEKGDLAAANPSPVDNSERENSNRILEKALDQLANKYKLPLFLFYFGSHSYQEISRILRWPMGTVKTNLYRGLKELRKVLGGEIHEFL